MSASPLSDRPTREVSRPRGFGQTERFSPSFDHEASVGIVEIELEPNLRVKELAPFDGARSIPSPLGEAWCAPGVHKA
jgi:hypothetical protein